MAEEYSSIKVKDLASVIRYYQDRFDAELVDQTDSSALMLLGNTLFEFIVGFNKTPASLTIEWNHYKGFKDKMKALGLEPTVCNHYHRVNTRDVMGNIITFSYYEMLIPSQVMVEII